MGRIKAHRKTELPVRPPAESSVVSVTSPYFDAENTTDEIETNRKRRRSGCVSVWISQVTDKPEIDNDLGENCSGKMLCTKSRSVSIKHKKPVASELPPSRGYHCDKKMPVRSKMSDLSAESLLNQKEEDEPSDIHHRLPSKRSCVQSGAESKITRKPVHSGKRPVRCTEVDHKQCEEEVRVNSESVVSSSHVVQPQENLDSSHSLEINKPPRSKKRRRGNLLLFSEFPHDSPLNKTTSSSPVLQNSHLDESDEADWEEVNEEAVGEVDIMQTLLGVRSKVEAADADKQTDDEPLTVSVPLRPMAKKSCRDPATVEAQARAKLSRELYSSMHVTHVLCYLAFSRYFNKICDSVTYRAVGLSLLGNVSHIISKKNSLLEPEKWTTDHLSSCLSVFLTHSCRDSTDRVSTKTTIFQRVVNGHCSISDCALLFVSALRVINFDVRLVVGLTPIPLKPPIPAEEEFALETIPSRKPVDKPNRKELVKPNRKIISSDESDFEPAVSRRSRKKSVREFDPPRYYLLAEVFLPKLNRWICIDFHKPLGLVDKIPKHPSMFYVIGMTTTFSDSLDTQPYIGRNPIDLASRYDPDWCIQSRLYRLPADRWSVLLQFQRLYFDKDAAQNNSLIARTGSLSTELRDRADEDSIRSGLLVKPMPEKVQDFKNHPLYILPRHLLKFEVIHPPDALPLGFFRGEPIYSRDCLHLCHTRESWLREAKVVKDFEQPAKVVKARPSLKRKLLQGSDPTPPMVEIFGSWQVEDYQPPVAKDGVVPRNIHGTIDLFKPCMLPVGCAHICLTGIQHVAKKLGIDCAPAVSGWKFHGSGWAIPIVDGYVVCQETVPALLDAWRSTQMNVVKMAAQERSDRALDNWRRLVRGLFLWRRVKAQFALAPLYPEALEAPRAKSVRKRPSRKSEQGAKSGSLLSDPNSLLNPDESKPDELGSLVMNAPLTDGDGWQRLACGENSHRLPIFPVSSNAPTLPQQKRPTKQSKARGPGSPSRGRSKGYGRQRKRAKSSTEEEDSETTPASSDTE